jgi:dolichol-phosphate mannosyltransferase
VKLLALRWLKFNVVGGIGIVVQLAALEALSRLGLPYLWATGIAVELAILHNFVWHERFTWKDRSTGGWRNVADRLMRFHAGNGVISLVGNLLLMRWFVGGMHLKRLVANGIAIAICSLLNFAASEWFVFRPKVGYDE